MYDGLSYDGIVDNGNDYHERIKRAGNNKILVNGSVGEVFRHFYYWPNRSISIERFIQSFHCRYDLKNMGEKFSELKYQKGLKQVIKLVLKTEQDQLSREQVEKLYPLLRARYWSAKDMINNHRFGLALYPFMEYGLIQGTSHIAYNKKLYGRFEASLIKGLAPKLAACKSDYGFSFDTEPPTSYKLKTQLITYQRPVWLRQKMYALKNSKKVLNQSKSLEETLKSIIDINYPYMGKYFKKNRQLDNDTFNRLVTVEYIAQKYMFIS